MSKLDTIAELFQSVDPSTRLELLLEYSGRLPPLPEQYAAIRDAGINMVHECQSPVFLMVEVKDGRVRIHADVPEEAPTARGFTSILVDAFDHSQPEEVVDAPVDVLRYLGLQGLLGMQRTRGLTAVYMRLKREVERLERTT